MGTPFLRVQTLSLCLETVFFVLVNNFHGKVTMKLAVP